MIPLAVVATICALIWTVFVLFANAMRDGDGEFVGTDSIILSWVGVVILWITALLAFI